MREKILAAAAEEIEQYNANFRMDDLARNLSISKRTLYEYFHSKNEIIETILTEKLDYIYREHRKILHDGSLSLEDRLIAFFSVESHMFNTLNGQHIRELFNKMPFLISRLQEVGMRDWQQLEDFLVEEQKLGVMKDISIDTLVLMLRGMTNDILYDKDRSIDDVMANLREGIRIILYGVIKEKRS